MNKVPEGLFTKKTFSELIEKRVSETKMTYIDAILEFCKQREIDPSEMKTLISTTIKSKLEVEGMKEGYLKKKNAINLD